MISIRPNSAWIAEITARDARIRELEAALQGCVDADSQPYGGAARCDAISRARQLLEPALAPQEPKP